MQKKQEQLANEVYVICFHCKRRVKKKDAFYINVYDTYLCEEDYLAMLDGKPIKLSNWKTRGM